MTVATAEISAPSEPPPASRATRVRHRKMISGVVIAVVLAVGATLSVTRPFAGRSSANRGSVADAAATSFATVARRVLSAQTQVDATLGFGGNYSVVDQAHGTITSLPAIGQRFGDGQVLYEVDGSPVVLLAGSTPAYRDLSEGPSASPVTGPDVQELNADLVALGYATRAQLDPSSDEFSWRTKQAVAKLQAHLGVTKNGVLALGQAVFLPSALRITALGTTVALGTQAQPGSTVLQATSPKRLVTIALDAAQQSEVKAGDAVSITLPNGRTTRGVVTSVGTVATTPSDSGSGASSNPTIEVDVKPTDPAATGTLDQAPVTVAITTATVRDALVVPVAALLALAGGGYAVEAVAVDGTHHLIAITLGLFDDADGLVQVTGTTLRAGQRIVVPTS